MTVNPVDEYVGKRLRLRRTLVGVSQESLAESLGITFQQVQKYEKAINRVSASRLYEIAKILNIPVSFFFDEYGEENPVYGMAAEEGSNYAVEETKNRESLALLKAYYQISEPKIRKKALELIKSLADAK